MKRLAGAGGFEPPYGGIKIRCLTTWLRPTVRHADLLTYIYRYFSSGACTIPVVILTHLAIKHLKSVRGK